MDADCWQTNGCTERKKDRRRTEEGDREREKVDIFPCRKMTETTKTSKKERRQNIGRRQRRESDRQKRELPRFIKVQHSEEFGLSTINLTPLAWIKWSSRVFLLFGWTGGTSPINVNICPSLIDWQNDEVGRLYTQVKITKYANLNMAYWILRKVLVFDILCLDFDLSFFWFYFMWSTGDIISVISSCTD